MRSSQRNTPLHDLFSFCSSNGKAVKNFDDAIYYLRGNKLIDYKQLGLKYKLYDCEVSAIIQRPTCMYFCHVKDPNFIQLTVHPSLQILTNRAIAYARLGEIDNARDDFLQALQSKAEPRHSVIDDALFNWKVCTMLACCRQLKLYTAREYRGSW